MSDIDEIFNRETECRHVFAGPKEDEKGETV